MTRVLGVAYASTGERIEVNDWFSLSSIILHVSGGALHDCDCEDGCGGEEQSIELPRTEVEQLAGRLSAWLDRGAL